MEMDVSLVLPSPSAQMNLGTDSLWESIITLYIFIIILNTFYFFSWHFWGIMDIRGWVGLWELSVSWIWGRAQLDEQGIRFGTLQKCSVNFVHEKISLFYFSALGKKHWLQVLHFEHPKNFLSQGTLFCLAKNSLFLFHRNGKWGQVINMSSTQLN